MLYQGVTGKIAITLEGGSETYIAHMTNWSVDLSMGIDETAFFGGSASQEGFTEKTPGVKSWTASADGATDFDSTSGQRALIEAYSNQQLIEATFYLDEDTGLQGEAYIESLTISHAADGKAEISIGLSGNASPTMIYPD